jgi:hypothetical protein
MDFRGPCAVNVGRRLLRAGGDVQENEEQANQVAHARLDTRHASKVDTLG